VQLFQYSFSHRGIPARHTGFGAIRPPKAAAQRGAMVLSCARRRVQGGQPIFRQPQPNSRPCADRPGCFISSGRRANPAPCLSPDQASLAGVVRRLIRGQPLGYGPAARRTIQSTPLWQAEMSFRPTSNCRRTPRAWPEVYRISTAAAPCRP